MSQKKEHKSKLNYKLIGGLAGFVLGGSALMTTCMMGYEAILDSKPVRYSENDGRKRVDGAGFFIEQSRVDPTIVRVIELGNFEQLGGLRRGSEKLTELCGSSIQGESIKSRTELLYQYKVNNADDCLKNPT